MSLGKSGYYWIHGALWGLELAVGPFWEPARSHPALTRGEIVDHALELEGLLCNLKRGRQRSVLFALLYIAAFVSFGVVAAGVLTGEARLTSIVVALAGTVVSVESWFRDWSQWPRLGRVLMFPSAPTPAVPVLIAALRSQFDAYAGASESDSVAALDEIRARAPLAFEASMRLTLLTDRQKRLQRDRALAASA